VGIALKHERTGERGIRKRTCLVRRGARRKGLHQQCLARGLPYFVCFCETREDAERVQGILTEWLKERGLALSPEKTRIVHLSEGFDFLGFNVRHYPAPQTARSGWKLLIKPSKEAVQDVRKKLKDLWDKGRGSHVQAVLAKLNPVIRGWANYFRSGVAKAIFGQLDRWMFYRADRYTRRMHPNKHKYWRKQHYWGRLNFDRLDSWVFGDKPTGGYLLKFNWFPIERHVLVKGAASPDDPCLTDYWTKRQARSAKDLTFSKQKLAGRQRNRCPECGESLFNDEELQVHHLLARSLGGKNTYSNLALVHLLCHQHIHAKTERAMRDCQQFNDRELTEENANTRQSRQEEKKELCRS
jgi:RNA-directed DNA polymerase